MADVKLLKYDGTEQRYLGVERVQLAKADGGTAIFSEGEAVEGIEITPDFSSGDMTVDAPEGTLVKSAVIKRPDTLIPENIPQGINIGGVEGSKVIPISVEEEIILDFSDGDMEVTPESGKVFDRVTILVPENLVPENIPVGTNVAGVDGSMVIPDKVNTEITLDFSDGAMEVVPDAGTVFSKVSIPVPEGLAPENIPKGVTVAGIEGTREGGGSSFDDTDEGLKYFVYKVDNEKREVILYGVLYSQLYANTGSYDVTVPDRLGGYNVVIASEGVG